MRREKAKIHVSDDTRLEVDGYRFNKHLFIHREMIRKGEWGGLVPSNLWKITHKGTGRGFWSCVSLKKAEECAMHLMNLELPFTSTSMRAWEKISHRTRERIEDLMGRYRTKRPPLPYKPGKKSGPSEMVPAGHILTDEVKKGDILVLKGGRKAYCADNRKGIMRIIKVESMFGGAFGEGSSYVFDWRLKLQPGGTLQGALKIHFTASQMEKAKTITGAGISL